MNIPLAVTEDTLYGQLTIPMVPGDRLFVYTDGIIDTPGPKGVCFGLERLKDVLNANTKAPIAELKSAVLQALHQYAGKELTHDDVTLIALEIG
jgi:sigma-B regulation protein RsbU (phosphoserine phosphatase)